jgi:hypothetical protein
MCLCGAPLTDLGTKHKQLQVLAIAGCRLIGATICARIAISFSVLELKHWRAGCARGGALTGRSSHRNKVDVYCWKLFIELWENLIRQVTHFGGEDKTRLGFCCFEISFIIFIITSPILISASFSASVKILYSRSLFFWKSSTFFMLSDTFR